MNLEYSLLENGFDFLVTSINDFNIAKEENIDEQTRKRLLKYSVLHLSSGIELIFKYKLVQEHWTYIFADMNKANKQCLEDGELKSVDSQLNVERLKKFCEIDFSNIEKSVIENLRKRRNKIEHFKIRESIESIESLLYSSLSLIIRFIATNIDLKKLSEEEEQLLDNIQKETLNLKEIIDAREKMIVANAKQRGILDELVICPNCLKKFLFVDDTMCLFCYYSDTSHNIAETYISNVLEISAYSCIKEGQEYPLYDCIECQENSMILDDRTGRLFCFNCKFEERNSNINFCCECGHPFNKLSEEDIEICNNCLDYLISQDN